MPSVSNILIIVAVAAVGLVLAAGFYNMFRGGPPERSQKLMRWRVAMQLLALLIVLGVIYARGHWRW
jgi:hypothetical protein